MLLLNEKVCCLFAALPYGLQLTSEPVSRYGNQYTVQWVVSSYSQLVDFTLYVKQVMSVSVNSTSQPATATSLVKTEMFQTITQNDILTAAIFLVSLVLGHFEAEHSQLHGCEF